VFSLGIVLFEVVTRTRLLPRLNDLDLLTIMGGTDALPKPTDRRADTPPGLEAIIQKAMTRKRELRYQTARELHEALDAWVRESGKVASAGDLADYLRTVFARRIHERRQLIETAMTAEMTPSSARQLSNMVARQASEGSSASHSGTRRRDGLRKRGPMVALVALSVVVLAIFGAVIKRMTDAAAVPVEPPAPVVLVRQAPVLPPVLVIETVPPGAMITVDERERGKSPQTLEELGIGTHQVLAALEGYQPGSKSVSLSRGGERVMVELALVPVPPPVVDAGIAKVTPTKVTPKKARPVVEVPGKLSLKTTPWTMVYLGKKKLGDTPLVNVSLPPGRHLLRLVSPETNAENSIEVEIKSNETTVKKLKL
jgi:serine/threonine-protein kinase